MIEKVLGEKWGFAFPTSSVSWITLKEILFKRSTCWIYEMHAPRGFSLWSRFFFFSHWEIENYFNATLQHSPWPGMCSGALFMLKNVCQISNVGRRECKFDTYTSIWDLFFSLKIWQVYVFLKVRLWKYTLTWKM